MNDEEKLLIELSQKLIESKLSQLTSGIHNLAKTAVKDFRIRTGKAFKNYFEAAVKKYSKTKTILYRTTPMYLYDFYVHVDLDDHDHTIQTSEIDQLLFVGDKILITGTAGSGKSTLLKHLFLNIIENQHYLPIFIEMKNLTSQKTKIIDFIHESLSELNFDLEKSDFERLLKSGAFVFLLDAYDEVDPDISRSKAFQLQSFIDKYHKNNYILTSRPDEKYISWSNFHELTVLPFSKEKCLELIDKLDYDSTIKANFSEEIRNHLYGTHKSFLSNPLLTTIMLMTFDQFGEIPNKMHNFYAQAFETLFSRHDALKGGFKRNMHTKLALDEFEKLFSGFCVITYFKNKINFTYQEIHEYLDKAHKITDVKIECSSEAFTNDLLQSLSIIIQDGFKYTFTHRTFQEYFTAVFIKNAKPEQRKVLITKLLPKLNTDNTAKLVWEIDRKAFEDDFLIEELEEVYNKVEFSESDATKSFVKYLEWMNWSFTIDRGGLVRVIVLGDEHGYHQLLTFTDVNYNKNADHSNLFGNNKQAANLYRLYAQYECGFPTSASNPNISKQIEKYMSEHQILSVKMEDALEYSELYEAFLSFSENYAKMFLSSMKVLEQIKREKKLREQSIEDILITDKT